MTLTDIGPKQLIPVAKTEEEKLRIAKQITLTKRIKEDLNNAES